MFGSRIECPNCHEIFYDMEKQEVACPNCHYYFSNLIHHCHFNSIYDRKDYTDLKNDYDIWFGDSHSGHDSFDDGDGSSDGGDSGGD